MGRRTNRQLVSVHYDEDTNTYTVLRPDGLPTSRSTQKMQDRAIKFCMRPMSDHNERLVVIKQRLYSKLTQKQN